MKLPLEFIEHALQFEHLAAEEPDPDLKAEYAKPAKEYRARG